LDTTWSKNYDADRDYDMPDGIFIPSDFRRNFIIEIIFARPDFRLILEYHLFFDGTRGFREARTGLKNIFHSAFGPEVGGGHGD